LARGEIQKIFGVRSGLSSDALSPNVFILGDAPP
jgi:hypothetical protein